MVPLLFMKIIDREKMSKNKNTWFTSDTHFGHKKCLQYCKRPFSSINSHDETLIKNWNNCVNPYDTVYHLGDFCFTGSTRAIEILDRLNGNIHLIKGNHDFKMSKDVKARFKSVTDLKQIKIGNTKIIMCHYAFRVWNCSHHGSVNLCGHSHGMLDIAKNSKQLDVGVDVAKQYLGKYRPFKWQEVQKILHH